MFSEERQALVLSLVQQQGSVRVGDLTQRLDVSVATIRRDLAELEKDGLAKRTHGGAVSVARSAFESSYSEAAAVCAEEKRSIAMTAASLVSEGDSIMLDSGTTTEAIAKELVGAHLTIITNSTMIPHEQSVFKPDVYRVGGLYRATTRSTVGPEAERFVRSLRPDKAFIAANGVLLNEVSTADINESAVKRAMIDVAKSVYLVVDHSKFGRSYLSVIATLDQFDAVITDVGVEPETREFYESQGVSFITEGVVPPPTMRERNSGHRKSRQA